MNKWLACALVIATSGCPSVTKDDPADEFGSDPIVEFDPGASIVPFPNNLLIDQMTGRVNLPASCNETATQKALREQVLNKLDGFGTFETAMSVTLTAPIDMASVTSTNVLLYKIASGTTPVDPSAAILVPVVVIPGQSIRYENQTKNDDGTVTCDGELMVDSITIVPRVPLDQKSTYAVALLNSLNATVDGAPVPYTASFTWSLVRQAQNPVTVENGVVISDRTPLDPNDGADLVSLLGVDQLWNAHAPVLQFLEAKSVSRDDVLLAWSFRTQTVTDSFDRTIAGTPLTQLNDVPLTGPTDSIPVPVSGVTLAQLPASRAALPFSVCTTGVATQASPEPDDLQCLLKMLVGGGFSFTGPTCAADTTGATCQTAFVRGTIGCGSVGCTNIGALLLARVKSPQFQINVPNPIDAANPIPGPWSDPVKPAKVEDEQLALIITVPTGSMPTGGWPTIVYQHGLGRVRTDLLAIGGSFARDPDAGGAGTGFAMVAMDAVAHGSRQIRISNTGDCATAPLPTKCFAAFLSPDLAATRDNIRQTVVDHAQLVASLKKCTGGASNCGTFIVSPTRTLYLGMSLGGIIGGITFGIEPTFKTAALNVPAVGWADIFENTANLDIRCSVVDGLIASGTIPGTVRDTKGTTTTADDTGTCVGQEWKLHPGYRRFAAIGRWVLDPGEPANYYRTAAVKRHLIQEVKGDTVVPNVATDIMGALYGRTKEMAKTNTTGTTTTPTPAIAMAASKWIEYVNVAPNLGASFPGNTYNHGSLLTPAASVNATDPTTQTCGTSTPQYCDGVFGTAQFVTDLITWLQLNQLPTP